MQGKWNTIIRFSGLVLLMVLLCLPCFAKQNLKQSWGIPVAEGKSVAKISNTICNYSEFTSQRVKQEVSSKEIIPSRSNQFVASEKALASFQVKDYLALLHKPYLHALHILFQQFRI
jgi:hypothetical protein